jgi:hypothetical protein
VAAFGIASLVDAIGALMGGLALARLLAGARSARWSLLASGTFVVAVVTPATIPNNLTVRYLALAVWSLMLWWMATLVSAGHRTGPNEAPTDNRRPAARPSIAVMASHCPNASGLLAHAP